MNLDLPPVAVEFAHAAQRAIVEAGGVGLARRAEREPLLREGDVRALLEALGATELDVRSGEDSAYAGAELCRIAGRFAFPFPVASLLACPKDLAHRDGRRRGLERPFRFAVLADGPQVARRRVWADHGDLRGPWLTVTLDGGRAWEAEAVPVSRNPSLAPFVHPMRLGPPQGSVTDVDRCWLLNLSSWQILGAVEAAHALAVGHVTSRQQFGRPLAGFQGVQFQVADAEVAVRGLRQLARFTLWRLLARPEGGLSDSLALRSIALETAQRVLATSQLLHGATGFCDEHDLTTVFRAVQAPLRLPFDLERTNDQLASAIDRHGFESLFGEVMGADV